MIVPVPWMASSIPVFREADSRYATLYAWIYDGELHIYYQLFSEGFFITPQMFRYLLPSGSVIRGEIVFDAQGQVFDAIIFEGNQRFTVEFPASVDLSEPGPHIIQMDCRPYMGASLRPLKKEELAMLDPETEQQILDVVVSRTQYLYRYSYPETDPETGQVIPAEQGGRTSWFYQSDVVPPETMLEMCPWLKFDGCEGLLLPRHLKPGYVIEDGHGGIESDHGGSTEID